MDVCTHIGVEANEQTEVTSCEYIEYIYGLGGTGGLGLNPSQTLEHKTDFEV